MSNRLPETDLANWSFLPPWQKRTALEAFEGPKIIKGSYEPFRRVFPDAVNQQFPLFRDELQQTIWASVEKRLTEECGGNATLIQMNREILAATHAFADARGISATAVEVTPLRFAGGLAYSFGLTLLIRYKEKASFVFLDLRRSNNLGPNGRRFMFSAMHHRFREGYSDFAEADIQIWRYKNDKSRTLVAQSIDEVAYNYEQIAADVLETHQIWEAVKRRGGDQRRASGGGAGPLFE